MNVYVVVDYILKLGDTSRNWLQMSNTVHQVNFLKFVIFI